MKTRLDPHQLLHSVIAGTGEGEKQVARPPTIAHSAADAVASTRFAGAEMRWFQSPAMTCKWGRKGPSSDGAKCFNSHSQYCDHTPKVSYDPRNQTKMGKREENKNGET